ncbi:MAG: acetylornithine deacetylase [Candidatus Competibacteraceae bacterium]|nr:acetylornithine deacetylase [Candidatus Competibacteraceae bacterium]MCP5125861.1 acetylornithine deacetylase [Gammaproteobacteria bacterium]HRX70521.1 acetylornithine deacetylase [Candidatus Competibacteraceae bacterium]
MPPSSHLVEHIRQLIAVPSVSSVSPQFDQSNRPVIDLLAGWLEDLGFAIRIEPLPERPDKANLIATLGSGSGGLVLAGHTDTVPFDADRWRFDPFGGVIADERIYGLGSTDMKSFLALAIEAAREFATRELSQPLVILATADEESSMHGAQALAAAGQPLGRHAVIGEPTELKPVRMHKGILMEAIRLEGRSGHSSNPALGVNALEGMHGVIGELLRWRAELQARYRNPLFEVAVPTLNLGHIHGGDNPNRICGDCELHIDIRPLPGMTLDGLREELHARLGQRLADSQLKLSFLPLFPGVEALETPATAAIVQAAEALTGAPAGVVSFGTEGPYLNALGMETVILGPGSVDCAHQPDEFLPLATIQPMLEILRGLMTRFCLS